ncbi:MAG: hypothetical protein KatS3mg032_0746 [Cyclobacteriaceae bacterium]|nr:MAG: hypothetical protein KatS3mg032_0746 [Cyclobacteriaceae bacterium]
MAELQINFFRKVFRDIIFIKLPFVLMTEPNRAAWSARHTEN